MVNDRPECPVLAAAEDVVSDDRRAGSEFEIEQMVGARSCASHTDLSVEMIRLAPERAVIARAG